jgi:2-polyprenyl-6-hydroxyphenyl methylase/3-demethylubiquinone-9 3-methyltransferase
MGRPPAGVTVRSNKDIRVFFDGLAPFIKESHGPAPRLFKARMTMIKKHAAIRAQDTVLEIGCGHGDHLLALVGGKQLGVGIDLSPAMIHEARARARASAFSDRIVFLEGNAEDLGCLKDSSAGLALAVGSFEHMVDKKSVLKNVFRVLRPGGRFLCLSPNGGSLWYAWLAPRLKINTRHLSSDVFLSGSEFSRILLAEGFAEPKLVYWRFVPRGDVSTGWAVVLELLDMAGRFILRSKLRGGILVRAVKPEREESGHKGPGGESGA